MKCARCNGELQELERGEWEHVPAPSWRRNRDCSGPKPYLATAKDHANMKKIADIAQERDGVLIAPLSSKESRTALKRLVQLGWIAVRTVTYANWDHPGYVNWGKSAHTAFEALILTPTDYPINTELV